MILYWLSTTLLHHYTRLSWVSRYQKGKTSLDFSKARDYRVLGFSGISWAICKQSAPRSRQTDNHTNTSSLDFYRPDALPDAQTCQSTEGKRIGISTHTHTHPFNGPLSGTTRVSRYQKGKTNLDFTEARDSEWQWHQLGHMQVCTALQTDSHASTPQLSFFTGQMPFLPPNQQRQSTEGRNSYQTLG